MEIRHTTCTGIPDVKSPQCYQCKDLSICVLLYNNLKTMEKMFIHTQQVIENTCQTIIANFTRISEQQQEHSDEVAKIIIETNRQDGLSKQADTPTNYIESHIKEVEVGEIIEADVKKGVLEKGKQIFGIIKS